jgi:hypothetical protein
MDVVYCCIRVVSSGKGEERGWAWVAGESTPEPRRTTEKGKMRKTSRSQKVPDWPSGERGKAIKKKKNKRLPKLSLRNFNGNFSE